MARRPTVHIINPLENPYGGSEARVTQMAKLLEKRCNVKVWSEYGFHQHFQSTLVARRIKPKLLKFPLRGTFIFVGTYFWVGNWMKLARPEKVIVISNIPGEYLIKAFLGRLAQFKPKCPVTVGYASPDMAKAAGLPGKILLSPIDINSLRLDRPASIDSKFVIGRVSRDTLAKHHPDDIDLYKQLARTGYCVRLMGGTCLEGELADIENIELLPCGAMAVPEFLASLDCFFYRTAPEWFEPHGRVITEAMAAGVPVVAGSHGGYADFLVKHGETGFLVASNEEALQCIHSLRKDRSLSLRISRQARSLICDLNANSVNELVDYVLSSETELDVRNLIHPEMARPSLREPNFSDKSERQ